MSNIVRLRRQNGLRGSKRSFVRRMTKLNPRQRTQVKRIMSIRQETKQYVNSVAMTSVLAVPAIQGSFSTIAQGTGQTARVGSSIFMKRIRIRMTLQAADIQNSLRVIIFQWKENNANLVPAPTDIITLSTNPWQSAYNYTHKLARNFHICYDRTFSLSSLGSPVVIDRTINLYGKRLGAKHLVYEPATSSGTNQYYMLVVSDSVGAPNPAIGTTWEFYYTDS